MGRLLTGVFDYFFLYFFYLGSISTGSMHGVGGLITGISGLTILESSSGTTVGGLSDTLGFSSLKLGGRGDGVLYLGGSTTMTGSLGVYFRGVSTGVFLGSCLVLLDSRHRWHLHK